MDLTTLSPGSRAPELVQAIIEIPRGGRVKYEYDRSLGLFRVDRVLASAVQYPAAYGFIPGTLAEDGDALDILVMVSEPTITGCVIEARPVGLLQMRDEKGGDEKILSVAAADPEFDEVRALADVSRSFLKQVEHFFRVYKQLDGKGVEIVGWEDEQAAERAIEKAAAAAQ